MLHTLFKYKYIRSILSIGFIAWCFNSHAQSCCDEGCSCIHSDIAPAGIMNDHLHAKGEWMVSYRFMRMDMQSNINGSQSVSDGDVYNSYLMSPNKMSMDMNMIMIMYGLSNRVTLMLMPTYNVSTMSMNMYGAAQMQMPGMEPNVVMPNSQSISGFSDTKLYGLFIIAQNSHYNLVASAGLSLPTGSINEKAFTSVYSNLRADYNMQTGTGTVDFLPGISLLAHEHDFDWGIQAMGTYRPFYNANGYHFGNEGTAELWVAKKWNSFMSNSIRMEATADAQMSGNDKNLYAIMEPPADASNYGGFRSYIYPGINFYPGTLLSTTFKIRIEYGLPVYEYANGIQMAGKSNILANLDLIF